MVNKEARIMPHSIEGEQSVLGCVLIDQSAAINAMADIHEEDFYVEAHKIIFRSMFKIYKTNAPIDFVTLTDELEKVSMLESVGGAEYITTLTNIVPSSASFKHYADIVKRNSILRQLINAGNKIINYCYEMPDSADAIAFAEKCVFDISQTEDRSNLVHIKQVLPVVIEKFETIHKDPNSLVGLKTKFFGLDNILKGLQKSDLILIAGRPASGKTSFAMNIVSNIATTSNATIAVFSLEMPCAQLAQRALCSVAYTSMETALKGKLGVNDWKNIWAANEKLGKSNLFIDDSSLTTPSEILSKCRRLKAQYGLDLIVVDYLQLMSAAGRNNDNRQQEISEISRNLKIVAKELNIPVVVLSQLSRAVESRSDHRPMLSDLRESGAIEQDADIVMFVTRDDYYQAKDGKAPASDMAKIIVAKHRNGPLGDIPLKWIGETTTFVNLERDSNSQSLENLSPPPVSNNNDPEIAPMDDEDITDIF